MSSTRLCLAVVVLAAGAASRYSERPGAKLLAELDGEPVLSHVLGAVRAFAPAATVVVLGSGGDEIETSIEWSGETRVRNPAPERGLSSSIRVGIAALEAGTGDFDGVFIVLGDQPRLRADVMHLLGRIAAQSRPADRPLVVPRYTVDKGPRNPVLLLRPAWVLARDTSHDLAGDRGFAGLIEARPDMVQEVHVTGAMPDIDTHEDLVRMRRNSPDEAAQAG